MMTRPGMKPLGLSLNLESARFESRPMATLGVVTNPFARLVLTTVVRSSDGNGASPMRRYESVVAGMNRLRVRNVVGRLRLGILKFL